MRGHVVGWIVTLGVLASCASVPSQSADRDALIDEFLKRSYLHQEAIQASQQYGERLKSNTASPTSEAGEKSRALSQEMEEALRPESTVPLMRDYLRTQRAETLELLLKWLRTPLAERMLALAALPFDYSGFNSYQVPKNQLRNELIPRLDKATHESELLIQEAAERTKLFAAALGDKSLAAQSNGKMPTMIEQFLRNQQLRKESFIFRSASDQELQGYVEYLESPLGQVYVVTRRNALAAGNSKAQTVMAKFQDLVSETSAKK